MSNGSGYGTPVIGEPVTYTLSQQLAFVQELIRKIEANPNKRYRGFDGIEYEKHDLVTLYAREERLLRLINDSQPMEKRVVEF